jgi:DNA-damage-inducible protein J
MTEPKTSYIRARTSPGVKNEAEEILRNLGLTASDAINMFYRQIILKKGIPFDIKIPDEVDPNVIPIKNEKSKEEESDDGAKFVEKLQL